MNLAAVSRGFKGFRPVVFCLDLAGVLLPESLDSNRGRKGKRYPKRLRDPDSTRYNILKGVKMIERSRGVL